MITTSRPGRLEEQVVSAGVLIAVIKVARIALFALPGEETLFSLMAHHFGFAVARTKNALVASKKNVVAKALSVEDNVLRRHRDVGQNLAGPVDGCVFRTVLLNDYVTGL